MTSLGEPWTGLLVPGGVELRMGDTTVPRTITSELVHDAGARLGECPRWDGARQRLWWVDIDAGVVHDTDPVTGDDRHHAVGQKVGAVAPRRAGGVVLAVASGFALLDPASGSVERLVDLAMPADVIMNDGACDPAGRFWAGTAAEDERSGAGTVYRLDPDGEAHAVLPGVTLSNGLGWSPDGALMYYVDSADAGIDVFDFDVMEATATGRRRFVAIPDEDGVPDGLAVDHDGGVWVALWGGGQVRRYLPHGSLDRVVSVPTSHVTACAFGDRDGSTLYVTTAAGYLDDAERSHQPHAGGLFAASPGVTGPAATAFAG